MILTNWILIYKQNIDSQTKNNSIEKAANVWIWARETTHTNILKSMPMDSLETKFIFQL